MKENLCFNELKYCAGIKIVLYRLKNNMLKKDENIY